MRIFLLILLLPVTQLFSQELNCKVTVNFEGLQVNNRELLVDFGNIIESYVNNTQFTGEAWDGQKLIVILQFSLQMLPVKLSTLHRLY